MTNWSEGAFLVRFSFALLGHRTPSHAPRFVESPVGHDSAYGRSESRQVRVLILWANCGAEICVYVHVYSRGWTDALRNR
jgi:hypothetical protein